MKIHYLKTNSACLYPIHSIQNFDVFQNIQKIEILCQIGLEIYLNVLRIYWIFSFGLFLFEDGLLILG